jgi:hypothetical protein
VEPKKTVTRYQDGTIRLEEWQLNGKDHREDGPAFIWYSKSGDIEGEQWRLNGDLHREDGPAQINYHKNGSVRSHKWFLQSSRLYKKDFTYDQVVQMKATELFTPVELARLRLDKPI